MNKVTGMNWMGIILMFIELFDVVPAVNFFNSQIKFLIRYKHDAKRRDNYNLASTLKSKRNLSKKHYWKLVIEGYFALWSRRILSWSVLLIFETEL